MEEIKKPKISKKLWLIIGVAAIVVIVGISLYVVLRPKNSNLLPNPVATSISSKLSYNIYYPNPKKLPYNYSLNYNSFSVHSDALIYTVSFTNDQTLYFSLQKKPAQSKLNTFYSNTIPLHLTKYCPVGTATIGVVNNETVVSLPTNTNTWIIMTAPLNYNQQQLQQVLNSIQLAK